MTNEKDRSSCPLRILLDTDICDWCQKEKATITDGTYVYCSEEHKKLFFQNAMQAIEESTKIGG